MVFPHASSAQSLPAFQPALERLCAEPCGGTGQQRTRGDKSSSKKIRCVRRFHCRGFSSLRLIELAMSGLYKNRSRSHEATALVGAIMASNISNVFYMYRNTWPTNAIARGASALCVIPKCSRWQPFYRTQHIVPHSLLVAST